MDLPIVEMVINPEETSEIEVSFVALVDKPAIERNFLAFNSNQVYFKFDEDKRIISGPAMVADQLIYRKDQNGEYQVFFSAATIRDIAIKFAKKGYANNINLFHDPTLSVEGVTIFNSFVSDKSIGVKPMDGFEDLPDGSWFISAKVENQDVWRKVKSGEIKGFSVEGIFSFLKKGENRPVSQNSHLFSESTIMSELKTLWNRFKEKFLGELPANVAPAQAAPPVPASPAPNKLNSETTLKDGTPVSVDRLEVGGIVMINNVPAPAGELELADGTKLMVGEGGVITAVEMAGMPKEPVMDYAKQFAAYDEKLTSYETKFNQHIAAFGTLTQEFNQAKEQMKNLVELVGKMIETPTAETVTDNKSNFNDHKVTAEEKRKNLINLFATFKKK